MAYSPLPAGHQQDTAMRAPQCKPRRAWVVLVLLALLVFAFIYLPVGLMMLYNYAWWIGYSGTVRLAQPAEEPADSLPVPKLLHQTWRDKNLPEKWKAAQKSCMDAHPGYEYKLWTDEDAEQLIAEKFPWFLATYKSYQYNIQRADVLRYFVLYEYGGIYLDLDVECVKSLDSYRAANFTAPKTYPIGLSNDVMMARPKDPFSLQLITNLKKWNKWFFVRYATVMFSTGPMFVTIQYALYPHKNDFTVLPALVYGKYEKSDQAYLKHLHGSSWHGNDARYIFWLEHYGLKAAAVAALLLVTALTAILVQRRYKAQGGFVKAVQAWAGPKACSGHCCQAAAGHQHPPSSEVLAALGPSLAPLTGPRANGGMTGAMSQSNLRNGAAARTKALDP